MKKGIFISGFSDEIDADFNEQLKTIRELNMEYIEIRGVNGKNIADHSLEEVAEVKKALDLAGVSISAIGSPIGKINIKDDFEAHFELFKHVIEIAKLLKTNAIRLFSFFMTEEETLTYKDEVHRRLKAMVDYVAGTDMLLLHENEKDIYGDTPERCLDLFQGMNSDQFKLIFDPANFIQCGVETFPHAYNMLKDYVHYFHIKDAIMATGKVVPAGTGDGQLSEIFKDLKKREFAGFMSLEPHLGEFEGFNRLEPIDGISFSEKSDSNKFKLAHHHLLQLLSEAGIQKNQKTRIGVVGIGNMGTSHAIHLFEGYVKEAKLRAICDVKSSRLDWAKERFGSEIPTFLSLEGLIEANCVDAVLIATPHYDHPILGTLALKSGLHALVEKPIGVYTEAVEALNEMAKSCPEQVFTIMYNQRTNPLYRKVKAMIEGGELGELRRVNWIITDWYRTQYYYNSGGWRATWKGEGGGVLINQCPHQLDLIQWLCGVPSRVRAFGQFGKMHDIEVEDEVTAYLEYPNGATGVFITSTGEAPGTNRLEIAGDMGKIVVENGELLFYQNAVNEREHNKVCQEGFKKPENACIKPEVIGVETGHIGIMTDFVTTIGDRSHQQIAPGLEGIMGLSLSNAMHLSSWTDGWVNLPIDSKLFHEELMKRVEASQEKSKVEDVVLNVEGSH